MGISLRQTMRESIYLGLRDDAADDYIASAAGGGGGGGVTQMFNFRSTLAGPSSFPGDGPGETFISPTQVYAAGTTPGWIGSLPGSSANNNTTYGTKVAGYVALPNTTGCYFSSPIVPGSYKPDIGLGVEFGAQNYSLRFWDGFCGDTQNRDNVYWAAGGTYSTGSWAIYGANLYQRISGTTAGATPPTHLAGDVSDGGVVWRYIKTCVFGIDGNTGGAAFADATGAARTVTGWQTAHVLGAAFSLTQTFVTVSRGQQFPNSIRHIGLIAQ